MGRRSGLRIAWSWIWHSVLGGMVGLILAFIGLIVVERVLSIAPPRPQFAFGEKISIAGMLEMNNPNPLELLIIFPISVIIFAFCQAFFQQIVLKQIAGKNESVDRWASYSALGAGLGGVLAVLLTFYPPKFIDPAWVQVSGYLVITGAIVIFQWRALRHAFSRAHLWIWTALGALVIQWITRSGVDYSALPSQPVVMSAAAVLVIFSPLAINAAAIAWIAGSVIEEGEVG